MALQHLNLIFLKYRIILGSLPALVATPLLITAISTSDKARAVCCASTAVILNVLDLTLYLSLYLLIRNLFQFY